jgi:hypothetical protein
MDWVPLPRSSWDAFRLPIPRLVLKPNGARYKVSLAGIIRRNDGLIWQPLVDRNPHTKLPKSIHVRLGGGSNCRSLALLMHETFAVSHALPTCHPTDPQRSAKWRPWLYYAAEHDPLTGVPSCSIANVVLAPHLQTIAWVRGDTDVIPSTRTFAAYGRDVAIPERMLLDGGYSPRGAVRHGLAAEYVRSDYDERGSLIECVIVREHITKEPIPC